MLRKFLKIFYTSSSLFLMHNIFKTTSLHNVSRNIDACIIIVSQNKSNMNFISVLSDKETLLFKMAKELEKRGLIKIVNNTVYKDTNIVHLHVIKKIPA